MLCNLREHQEELQLYGLVPEEIEELLYATVKFLIFRFNNVIYKQERGLAMGNRLAPLLAVLFMDSFEKSCLTTSVLYYLRYIDDIIVIAKSRAGLRHVFNALNSR